MTHMTPGLLYRLRLLGGHSRLSAARSALRLWWRRAHGRDLLPVPSAAVRLLRPLDRAFLESRVEWLAQHGPRKAA